MPPKKWATKPNANACSLVEFPEDRDLEDIVDDIKNGVVHISEELHASAGSETDEKDAKESSTPDELQLIWDEMNEELESNPFVHPSISGKSVPRPDAVFPRLGSGQTAAAAAAAAADLGRRRRRRLHRPRGRLFPPNVPRGGAFGLSGPDP